MARRVWLVAVLALTLVAALSTSVLAWERADPGPNATASYLKA